MTTYDLALIGGTVCGIIMVTGGIILLYKGSIKLEVAAKDPALTLELFQKHLKLTTSVPALGLFVIGFLFIGLSIYFARETTARSIELQGETTVVDEPVSGFVRIEWPIPMHNGKVHYVFRPQLDVFWLNISAPGYVPFYRSYSKNEFEEGVQLGVVKLERKVNPIKTNGNNITPLPPGVRSPPLSAVGFLEGGGL